MTIHSLSLLVTTTGLALSVFSSSARATALDFKTIHCVDANPAAQTPMEFDVENDVEDSDTGTRFRTTQAGTSFLGDIVTSVAQNQTMALSGTSDSRILIQLQSGIAKFSGPVFANPGDASTQVRAVSDYALNCKVIY